MRTPTRRGLLAALLSVALAAPLAAHNPLRTASGAPLHWPLDGSPVTFVIHEDGVAAIPDRSDELAIRRGLRAWEIPGAALDLQEDHTPEQRARTDYWSADGGPNDIHLLIFDETSDFFGQSSSIIATTVTWAIGSGSQAGTLVDADIIFNAGQFTFSTDLSPKTMDLEAIATHEAGHFVGFDHAGLQGSTMVPTAGFTTHSPRALTEDDAHGVRATYLGDTAAASVRGGLVHEPDGVQAGSPVRGLSVWAREADGGRVLAQATTDAAGVYELAGLPAGRYEVSATPYDGPLFASSLKLQHVDVDVGTTVLAGIDVPKKGFLTVPPRVLPPIAVGTPLLSYPGVSLVLQPGESVAFDPPLAFLGDDPPDAAGTLVFSTPRAEAWFDLSWDGTTLNIGSADDTPPGWYDLLATNAYGMDVYPGVLEIVPTPPVLDQVAPTVLGPAGSTELTLTGSSFGPHLAVHIGDLPATWVKVVDASTLRVGVPALAAGTWDVTLIDERSCRESRLVDALEIVADLSTPLLRDRQKLRGHLTGKAETDRVFIEGLPEALLSVAVRGDKKDGLHTRLVLRSPTGVALLSNDSTHPAYDPAFVALQGSSSRIRRFPLPGFGTYALEITALGDTTGHWTALQKQKVPRALRRLVLPKSAPAALGPGAPAVLEILAPSLSLVSGRLSSKDGATPVLQALQILGVDFAASPEVSAAVRVSPNGRSIRFKRLPLPAFGLVELLVGTDGLGGTLTGKLSVRPAKRSGGVQSVDV